MQTSKLTSFMAPIARRRFEVSRPDRLLMHAEKLGFINGEDVSWLLYKNAERQNKMAGQARGAEMTDWIFSQLRRRLTPRQYHLLLRYAAGQSDRAAIRVLDGPVTSSPEILSSSLISAQRGIPAVPTATNVNKPGIQLAHFVPRVRQMGVRLRPARSIEIGLPDWLEPGLTPNMIADALNQGKVRVGPGAKDQLPHVRRIIIDA